MGSVPSFPSADKPRAVALYARVSTEDQAERQTVQGQLDFLRRFCSLYGLVIADEYVDDGWSGAIPLSARPEGRQLLQDAEGGKFSEVLVYRLDRLGRSLAALLEAHDVLDRLGVTVRSATEPFDTSTPIGRFVFQLLGSVAELEKSTISERMTLGRNRVAQQGKWTGGPIPFGYALDEERRLVPSPVVVPSAGMTEAEIARDVFRTVASGGTTVEVCRRLNALGVPTARRYGSGAVVTVGELWLPSRINNMIRNPVYKGIHVLKAKQGPIERAVCALIDEQTWQAANEQLPKNRSLPKSNAQRRNLLRGLITCGSCGARYVGTPSRSRAGWNGYYYRCGSQLASLAPGTPRCRAKVINAQWLESLVWNQCRAFILNPGEYLEEARRQLRERLSETSRIEEQRRALLQQLAEKDAKRDQILTLFRLNRLTLAEVDRQLEAIARESAQLREMLDALRAQVEVAHAYEAHLTDAGVLLAQLRQRLEEIERTDDFETKRRVVELLVVGIVVETEGTGKTKRAVVRCRYAFAKPDDVVNVSRDTCVHSRGRD